MRKLASILFIFCVWACAPAPKEVILEEVPAERAAASGDHEKLSSYGFFSGILKDLNPSKGVIPYDINAPLFSDYASKKRFIFLPEGKKIKYSQDDVFDFPDRSVLIKNFYYPQDAGRIIETRLLIKEAGDWKALPYIWNDEQTEAFLEPGGGEKTVNAGALGNIRYHIPNQTQCKNCHARGDRMMPVGPTARQLNKNNQLQDWKALNIIEGLPADHQIPKLTAFEDESAAVDLRARSWLEANCAHCHRSDGPAKTSGLHLLASVTDPLKLGIGKAPVAAGKGSGGKKYDIIPGSPEESILYFRIVSNDPGIMMPELGRSVVHEEGARLISQWIKEMK
ncbi:MAG: SO2930 family diheme c-type cytochrome [Cyclobacteriaceae bacterium]